MGEVRGKEKFLVTKFQVDGGTPFECLLSQLEFSHPCYLTKQPRKTKPMQNPFNIFITVISLSLALATRQTPEIELYKVVHPRKLHILHKREVQNNQTETHGNEVSSVNGCGVSLSSDETIKNLFINRIDVISQHLMVCY